MGWREGGAKERERERGERRERLNEAHKTKQNKTKSSAATPTWWNETATPAEFAVDYARFEVIYFNSATTYDSDFSLKSGYNAMTSQVGSNGVT